MPGTAMHALLSFLLGQAFLAALLLDLAQQVQAQRLDVLSASQN